MPNPSRVLSIVIDAPLDRVAAFLADPLNFPKWASGLAGGIARMDQDDQSAATSRDWLVQSPEGATTIRFSPPNESGIADHWVFLPDGTKVYVPLRAVAGAKGTEVRLTLLRLPAMDDARFEADSEWIEKDLATLKRVLESA